MKRILGFGFGIFAVAVLSGCSPTLHPAITAQFQGNPPTITINGTGFSPTNPCASVALAGYPQAGTFTSINTQVPCTFGSTGAFSLSSPFAEATCPVASNQTVQAAVLAFDISTIDPAAATISLPCYPCQPSLKGNQIPTANWSASSTAPAYYATQSAILNSGNGAPITPNPSLSTIESAMGGAPTFNAATFSVANGTTGYGTGGGLPAAFMSCSYLSPVFKYQSQSAIAQVTIACTTTCGPQ